MTEQAEPYHLPAWSGFLRTHATVTRRLSAALEEQHGLTINEYEVLLCLALTPEHLQLSDLAGRAHLSPSGLTGMVNRLARRGLVRRCTSADDARAGYLELTAEGRDLFDRASRDHVARVRSGFLDRFSPAEQRLLGEFWARFPPSSP